MSPLLGEFIGTALLILLGNGVVANVVLDKTKGNNSGWIVITFGWGMAVFTGVYAATHLGSPGHINPAFTLASAYLGSLPWSEVLPYIAAQMGGAFLGAVLVWLTYRPHFNETKDASLQLAVFSTGPAIRNSVSNLIAEIIGTLTLVLGALLMTKSEVKLGTLEALPVALLVLGIGLSLGGPTGYAINPARDLGPRIAHAVLPMSGKGKSDWPYAWIPIVGPFLGALIAAVIYKMI